MELGDYVTLGRSGLKVSPLCLGALTFGEEYGFGCDAATAEKIIACYREHGGNFIDTANGYTRGHSERIIGDYLSQEAGRRDRLVIATKFSKNLVEGDPNSGGASRKAIIHACEGSLRRLRTDYIDLYWQHWEDPFTPMEETLRALDTLVASGKVRYLGFSDTQSWKVARAQTMAQFQGWTPLIALQIEYSLLERTVEGELLPMANELMLGVTPWAPLRGGILSGKYSRARIVAESVGRKEQIARDANERTFRVLDALISIAAMRETTPARVALSWLAGRKGVASPILGVRTVAQLEDNLAALQLKLSAEDIETLDAVSKPKLNFPAAFLSNVGVFSYGGLTVNNHSFATSPANPATVAARK